MASLANTLEVSDRPDSSTPTGSPSPLSESTSTADTSNNLIDLTKHSSSPKTDAQNAIPKLDSISSPVDLPSGDMTPPETPNATQKPNTMVYNDNAFADSGISASSPSSSECDQYRQGADVPTINENESAALDINKDSRIEEAYFYQCPHCVYRSIQKHNLSRHYKANHVVYQCRICDLPILGHRAIIEHVQEAHNSNDVRYRARDITNDDCNRMEQLNIALQPENRILMDPRHPAGTRQYRKYKKLKMARNSISELTDSHTNLATYIDANGNEMNRSGHLYEVGDSKVIGQTLKQLREAENGASSSSTVAELAQFSSEDFVQRKRIGDDIYRDADLTETPAAKRRLVPLEAWVACRDDSAACAGQKEAFYEQQNALFDMTWNKFSHTPLFDRALARALGHR